MTDRQVIGGHVVILGGAVMGSFSAWFLRKQGFAGRITVVEKDATYAFSSTARSAASIRTQFGTPSNIALSLFGVDFFRNVKAHFGPQADIGYRENGYLILGGQDVVANRMAGVVMQQAQGADVIALTPAAVKIRFPYLNTDDIGIGTFGQTGEGWFDAWSLLSLVRSNARALGVEYIETEATAILSAGDRVTGVRLASGDTVSCDLCVMAAGAASGRLMATLGVNLPVSPRKRTVFSFRAPVDGATFPMLFDRSGIWIRPEGKGFIGGIQPPADRDPDATGDYEPDHDLLQDPFWPLLAHRIPAMEELRLERSWAGHYEVNALDHNGVVGPHDQLSNLIFATGFSGHGVMHAPAVGRAVAEWIISGCYATIDMAPLSWNRIRDNRPLIETVVY
ncbi:NAD(P)/FAD-dependent oxidoreductase [Cypionkella sp. TWP1-2-1b2]|uniref:NAD(P)/FAD-dependent oxidoreductase n=1 Tax=Cypionkella sp. TWP1-2-1b2 TaxID=2804675 RepID=UPI003CF195B4